MIMKTKNIILCEVIGWAFIVFSAIPSYLMTVPNNCSIISRFNIVENPWSSALLIAGLALVSVGSFFILKDYFDAKEGEQKVNKKLIFFLLAAAFVAVPFNNHDINFYFSAGKMAASGVSMYTDNWSMTNQFYCPPSNSSINGIPYGPIAVSLFKYLYLFVNGNVANFILIWKILMGLCFVGSIFLAEMIASILNNKLNKAAFYLLWFSQPIILWEGFANGHFDVWLNTLVLLSILFSLKKKWWLVIVCLFIGIWIKFIPLLMFPWFALWWYQGINKDNWKKMLSEASLGLVASLFITIISWQPHWKGWQVFSPIILQTKWAVTSIFSVIYYSLVGTFQYFLHADAHWYLTRLVQFSLLALMIYLLYPLIRDVWLIIIRKKVGDGNFFIRAIFVSLLVYVAVWQKSFWPWYMVWLLPLGLLAFQENSSIFFKKILIWLNIMPLIFYPIWLLNHFVRHTDAPGELWFWYVVVGLVMVYPLYQLYQWRKKGFSQ